MPLKVVTGFPSNSSILKSTLLLLTAWMSSQVEIARLQ